MNEATPACVTEQHLLLFGTIIHCFARYEFLMEQVMATTSGADVASVKLLTAGLSFTEKRDAVMSLLRHRDVPADQTEQIRSYMRIPCSFISLRNNILHSVWVDGKPQGSIWPAWLSHGPRMAVKPLHDIDPHGRKFFYDDQDKMSYTLNDLKDIGQNLSVNCSALEDYAFGVGLIRSRVA